MDFNAFLIATPAGFPQSGMLFLVGAVLLLAIGIGGMLALRDPLADLRMRALATPGRPGVRPGTVSLLKAADQTPVGFMRSLVPEEKSKRQEIRLQLAQAGFDGPHSVRNFFLFRLGLAALGPVILAASVALNAQGLLPPALGDRLDDMSMLGFGQIFMVLTAVGFYGPGWWLSSRITARRTRIAYAFPNTLDLLQISIEAGLGFDAAMARVGSELTRVAPEISVELLAVQQEVLAGRDREQAMLDMAARLGIDEARSFVNVVIQSLQYGTSLTEALTRYAVEMRLNRELKAQEKANKLPVQMSGVMAVLMLPALFLITLAPTIIRYLAIFDN